MRILVQCISNALWRKIFAIQHCSLSFLRLSSSDVDTFGDVVQCYLPVLYKAMNYRSMSLDFLSSQDSSILRENSSPNKVSCHGDFFEVYIKPWDFS